MDLPGGDRPAGGGGMRGRRRHHHRCGAGPFITGDDDPDRTFTVDVWVHPEHFMVKSTEFPGWPLLELVEGWG